MGHDHHVGSEDESAMRHMFVVVGRRWGPENCGCPDCSSHHQSSTSEISTTSEPRHSPYPPGRAWDCTTDKSWSIISAIHLSKPFQHPSLPFLTPQREPCTPAHPPSQEVLLVLT